MFSFLKKQISLISQSDKVKNSNTKHTIVDNTNPTTLDSRKWEDTVRFTPIDNTGYVIKVCDGKTITIISPSDHDYSPLYRYSIRLNGIYTPEIDGKTEDEKEHAIKAKNALSSLILNKKIKIDNIKNDEYGGMLADIYLDDINVNDWLVEEKYAIKYTKENKRLSSDMWLKYYVTRELYY